MTVGAAGILGIGILLGFAWCWERTRWKIQELKDWQERREKDLKNKTGCAAERAATEEGQRAASVERQHQEKMALLKEELSKCHKDKALLKQKARLLLSAMKAVLPAEVTPDAEIAELLKEFDLGGKHDHPC